MNLNDIISPEFTCNRLRATGAFARNRQGSFLMLLEMRLRRKESAKGAFGRALDACASGAASGIQGVELIKFGITAASGGAVQCGG